MWKKITIALLVCVLGIIGYWYMNNNTANSSYSMLKHIVSKMNYKHELVDYDNEIGVKSIDDIAFTIKDGKIFLYYGKVTLELGKQELADDNFIDGLEKIGIKIIKKNGKYKITYWGEEIDKWID